MTRHNATRLVLAAMGLSLSPLAACSCGLTCGPGTADNGDGQCAPAGAAAEGEGEGEGEGDGLACGTGTTDNGNGQCVVSNPITCGGGTVETNGVCLPQGQFTPSPSSVDLTLPFDAAPSPDATIIYYTAQGSNLETHSLWSVPFDASADPIELATGFAAPLAIAVSSDGGTVFVGDAGDDNAAEADADDGSLPTGGIFAVDAASGAVTRRDGANGFGVRGLDLVDDDGTDVITFTGRDPATGARGVYTLTGNSVALVSDTYTDANDEQADFADPSGVAVAADGTRYVVDTSGGEEGDAAVIRITAAGAATLLVQGGMRAGYPAGAALSRDDATLFVSGLGVDNAALVYTIDVASGNLSFVNSGLGGNDESGGLHRAQGSDAFAWAGVTTVYGITFR